MNRRAVGIGIGAAILILVLWYFLLWSPRNDDLDEAKERRGAAEQQQSQLRSELARLRAAQRDEPLLRAQLEALRTAIPDEPNLAQFILDANDAAIRAGIDFISIAPSVPAIPGAAGGGTPTPGAAPAVGATPPEVRLALQIRGGYFQVLDFLNRLDALPRLVVTDALTVGSEPTASPRLTVGVTARMFVRTVPPSFGGPPTTVAPGTTSTSSMVGGTTTTTVVPGSATTAPAGGQP